MMRAPVVRDPTDPARWALEEARGYFAFQLRWGILAIGLPIAVLVDVVLLAIRGAWALFFSALHAAQLLLATMVLAPVIGIVAGRLLWRIGVRRYEEYLLMRDLVESARTPAHPAPPISADPRPRRLV